MKRSIYCMKDQVTGQYGAVIDFANDSECKRAMINLCKQDNVPDYILRDLLVVKVADIDYSGHYPVVTSHLPEVVFLGCEVYDDE